MSIIIFVTLKKLINFLFTQFLAQCPQNMTQLGTIDSPIAFLIENAETLKTKWLLKKKILLNLQHPEKSVTLNNSVTSD